MAQTLTATFATRREAEHSVEQLVQTHGIDRRAIAVAPEGVENSAGEAVSGGDRSAVDPSTEPRDDAALAGRIQVRVTVADDQQARAVRDAFAEASGAQD